jgi:transcriptional regulator with XRE-family HTH domain
MGTKKKKEKKLRQNTIAKYTQAAVLLRMGWNQTKVSQYLHIERSTVAEIQKGKDKHTQDLIESLKRIEDAQWTEVTSVALDTLLANPEKMANASGRDLVTMAAIAKDKRDGLQIDINMTIEASMSNSELIAAASLSLEAVDGFKRRLEMLEDASKPDYSEATDVEVEPSG